MSGLSSVHTRILRARVRHSGGQVAGFSDVVAPLLLGAERELFERIFGTTP